MLISKSNSFSKIHSKLLISIFLSLNVFSLSANAVIYYVSPTGNDSNTGWYETVPLKTIKKAVEKLTPGDTALLMDGTYTESQISFTQSGTTTQPITVKARNKHQAILSSTSGCNPNISLYASYIVIDGLRSSISPSNLPCGSNNSANGAAVRAWEQTTPRAPTLTNPAGTPSSGYQGCIIRNMLVDASPARSVGIKINQDNCLVENNKIYSSLEAFNNFGTIFRNNEIFGGDVWATSLYGKGGVRNLQIYNNIVHVYAVGNYVPWAVSIGGQSGNQYLYDPASGIEAYNSVAYNNVIINESGVNIDALGLAGAKDSALFNNVIIGQGRLFLKPSPSGYSSSNSLIQNNIFSCGGSSVPGTWSYTGTLNLDYNNFYNCSGTIPSQVHPVSGDPKFVDQNSNWHLQTGSSAIGAGVVVSITGYDGAPIVVNKDRDGVTRNAPWDLGIYEAP